MKYLIHLILIPLTIYVLINQDLFASIDFIEGDSGMLKLVGVFLLFFSIISYFIWFFLVVGDLIKLLFGFDSNRLDQFSYKLEIVLTKLIEWSRIEKLKKARYLFGFVAFWNILMVLVAVKFSDNGAIFVPTVAIMTAVIMTIYYLLPLIATIITLSIKGLSLSLKGDFSSAKALFVKEFDIIKMIRNRE